VFVDAERMVPDRLLGGIATEMDDSSCAGGAVDTVYLPARAAVRLYLDFWRVVGRVAGMAQGAAQFCRRGFFFDLGGYDESLWMGEDVDFYWRMRRAARRRGLRVAYLADV